MLQFESVRLEVPAEANIILGQSHFIKTVEDLYETLAGSGPHLHFGIAFCEASGDRLIRMDGNDEELKAAAVRNAQALGSGHCFLIVMTGGFPIHVLDRIKTAPEVCTIFCATANPVEVIVAVTEQGRGVMGVIDGFPPLGIESGEQISARQHFLRKIGYKR